MLAAMRSNIPILVFCVSTLALFSCAELLPILGAAAPAVSAAAELARSIEAKRGAPLDPGDVSALEEALRELSEVRRSLDEAERNADARCRVAPAPKAAPAPADPEALIVEQSAKAAGEERAAKSRRKLAKLVRKLLREELAAQDAGADR